jgi:hypothetical protein
MRAKAIFLLPLLLLACMALSVTIAQAQALNRWIQLVPEQRASHDMEFDVANNRLILFCGINWEGVLNDTWSVKLKPGTIAWKRIAAGGPQPPARRLSSMVYCSERQSMVVFGGYGYAYYNDAWELRLESGGEYWEQLSISGSTPIARDGHVAVYDPAGNRMIVFAGRMSAYDYFNDTWVLDFDTMSWQQLGISGPPLRANFEAIYDSAEHRMIIFGGEAPGFVYHNDVWALDLTVGAEVWTEIVDSGAIPEGRSSLCLEYDPVGHRMILQGGQYYDGSFHHLNDLRALDLSTNAWEEITIPGSKIEARRNSASALFRFGFLNYLFVHGGGRAGSDFYGDAWVVSFE